LTVDSGRWRIRKSLHTETLEYSIEDQRVVLAKPTTYMNESGRAVSALARSLKLAAGSLRLVVLHDDLDLPTGTIRLSQDGSSGGHRGVQSIIDALGTNEFLRLRIGIGPNATPDGHRIPSEKFVLEKFRKEERPLVDAAIQRAVEVVAVLIREGLAAAQQLLKK
jgi:PTH1 family peptidyl-tRNA hydrolase